MIYIMFSFGHIISDEPRVTGCFRSSEVLSWASQPGLISRRRATPWMIHSHLEASSAASPMFLVPSLSCNPLMPRSLDAGTALEIPQISQQALQLLALQASTCHGPL